MASISEGEFRNYAAWLEKNAETKQKPLSQAAQDFIDAGNTFFHNLKAKQLTETPDHSDYEDLENIPF